MKRFLPLFILTGVVFWSCEDEPQSQPEDCAGIVGGDNICGCTDSTSINYDSTATFDDGSCMDCAGVIDGDNICGCTDITAINYDSTATFDDGSCNYPPPQTYNYFDTSYNLKHPDLWLDYYEIPVANGLPLNGVDSEGNTFPFWYDAAVAIADFNGDGFEDILHSKTGSDLVTEEDGTCTYVDGICDSCSNSFDQVATGWHHSLGLRLDSSVIAWGGSQHSGFYDYGREFASWCIRPFPFPHGPTSSAVLSAGSPEWPSSAYPCQPPLAPASPARP